MSNDDDRTTAGWWILFTLCGFMVLGALGYLSVARYRGYNVLMSDLGRMSQAVWSGTQGEPLLFTSSDGPTSRLGLHVEVIYFLLVPLYALFPSPITLLIIQAALFTAGGLAVYRLARRHLDHALAALAVAVIYWFYPVAQTAVLFDFHGDTVAMPLLLFAVEALDRRAWKAYALWLALALMCKFYVAAPVAALGIVLWVRSERRAGLWTAMAGVTWGVMAVAVVRPVFAQAFPSVAESLTLDRYVMYYFGEILEDLRVTWLPRVVVAVVVFLPAVWTVRLAWPWWLPALAIGLPALLSTGPGPSYYYGYHHYALVTPFVVAAILYGLATVRQRGTRLPVLSEPILWPLALVATLMLTLALNRVAADGPLSERFWGADGALHDPAKYGRTLRDGFRDRWLRRHVPAEAPLAVSPMIAPHVINRSTVYMTWDIPDCLDQVEYVVADSLFDYVQVVKNGQFVGGVTHDWVAIKTLLQREDFALIAAWDGLLLFKRNLPADQALSQHVSRYDAQPLARQATFEDRIGLIEYHVESIEGRRYRIKVVWEALRPLVDDQPMVAVSRLSGTDGQARIVHLPTMSLAPPSTWKTGERVAESFEVQISEEIPAGTYEVWVGWYGTDSPDSYMTDERSRIGREVKVADVSVP